MLRKRRQNKQNFQKWDIVDELGSIINKNHLKKAIAFFGFCGIQYGGPKIDVLHPGFVKRQGSFSSKKLCACSRDPNSFAL